MKKESNCVYRVRRTTMFGKLIEKLIGPKFEFAHFHECAYSGNQIGNTPDICILELKSGQVITPKINDVFKMPLSRNYIS